MRNIRLNQLQMIQEINISTTEMFLFGNLQPSGWKPRELMMSVKGSGGFMMIFMTWLVGKNTIQVKYIFDEFLYCQIWFLGGRNWLDLTRGTDCTEAFETYHVFGVSESLLKKFWVKKATTPRRYRCFICIVWRLLLFIALPFRFTFHPDGFYKTLQRKGARILKETGVGPDWSSSVFQDLLTLSFLVCFAVLCQNPTIINAFITGKYITNSTV